MRDSEIIFSDIVIVCKEQERKSLLFLRIRRNDGKGLCKELLQVEKMAKM